MKGLEFFRNVSIGQYIDTGSRVHRLVPATKFLGIIVFFVVVFANTSITGTAVLGVSVLVIAILARVNPGFLFRGLIPALPFLCILILLTLLFQSSREDSAVLFSLGFFHLHLDTLLAFVLIVARFAAIVAAISLLTSVMSEREIAHGVEDAFSPFSRFGFPAHEFSLMITIAFRFVPIVTGELEAIVKAQASRGGDFGSSGFNPVRKARSYIPLFVPLIVRTLERAETLVEAMEARCYINGERTRYVRYAMGRGEWLVRLALLVYAILGVTFAITIGNSLP